MFGMKQDPKEILAEYNQAEELSKTLCREYVQATEHRENLNSEDLDEFLSALRNEKEAQKRYRKAHRKAEDLLRKLKKNL